MKIRCQLVNYKSRSGSRPHFVEMTVALAPAPCCRGPPPNLPSPTAPACVHSRDLAPAERGLQGSTLMLPGEGGKC